MELLGYCHNFVSEYSQRRCTRDEIGYERSCSGNLKMNQTTTDQCQNASDLAQADNLNLPSSRHELALVPNLCFDDHKESEKLSIDLRLPQPHIDLNGP